MSDGLSINPVHHLALLVTRFGDGVPLGHIEELDHYRLRFALDVGDGGLKRKEPRRIDVVVVAEAVMGSVRGLRLHDVVVGNRLLCRTAVAVSQMTPESWILRKSEGARATNSDCNEDDDCVLEALRVHGSLSSHPSHVFQALRGISFQVLSLQSRWLSEHWCPQRFPVIL